MIERREDHKPYGHMLDCNQKIEEWFKIFLKIIEDEYMFKELWKRLKVAFSEEEGEV